MEHESSKIRPGEYVPTAKDQREIERLREMAKYIKAAVDAAPPLTESQRATIAALLGGPPPLPSSLMRWRVQYGCGHLDELTIHISHRRPSSPHRCRTCDENVPLRAYEPIGSPEEPTPVQPGPPSRSRAAAEKRLAKLHAEVERLTRELEASE